MRYEFRKITNPTRKGNRKVLLYREEVAEEEEKRQAELAERKPKHIY